ncbi:uncharacterized protein LOC106066371 [Biomphalaria glabrata]|uniref:Uncharacterized protein LOC106066371 n=1 Tax=Biomphalaria glabrata TaxID=6526 RepID=A0A9U8EC49_BIOGL|nr:uncharacterized protein LOC106066371 [Biomphalaria glabrata]
MAELQRLLQSNEVFRFEPMKTFLSGLQQTSIATSPSNLNETTGLLPQNANVNLPRMSPSYNVNLNTTNLNTSSTITIDNQGHANINTNVTASVSNVPNPLESNTTQDANANVSEVPRLLFGVRSFSLSVVLCLQSLPPLPPENDCYLLTLVFKQN